MAMNCKYKTCQNLAIDSKICPHCCSAMYCSDICLKQDWESHRYSCTPRMFILKDLLPIKNSSKSLLGKGAYGEVQLVQHIRSKILYALKIIKKDLLKYTPIEIFQREISAHKSLVHPNIARLYDHLEDKNRIYLILEYVQKGTLYSLLKKKIKLQEAEACELFKQACIGVAFLHSKNIIHRDIKSENFLISSENVVKLCDFGWCAIGSQPRVTFCGTVDYMAPEMSQSESYNSKVDIWALGILLYELLHGRTPFVSSNVFEMFQEIERGNISFRPDISQSAKDLILGILIKDPNRRPEVKDIFKSSWFVQKLGCKLSIGSAVKHPDLGDGFVAKIEGVLCEIEFSRKNLKIVDSEAIRICEVKSLRPSVNRTQEFKSKPPLAKSDMKSPRQVIRKVRSDKEIKDRSVSGRMTPVNTSVESLFAKRRPNKRMTNIERSSNLFEEISLVMSVKSRSNSPFKKKL